MLIDREPVLKSPDSTYLRNLLERWEIAYREQKEHPTPENIEKFQALEEIKKMTTLSIVLAASK